MMSKAEQKAFQEMVERIRTHDAQLADYKDRVTRLVSENMGITNRANRDIDDLKKQVADVSRQRDEIAERFHRQVAFFDCIKALAVKAGAR